MKRTSSSLQVLALLSAIGLSACAQQQGPSHGLAPEKQPEITMVRYAHDIAVQTDQEKLDVKEREKLHYFLDRHGAGYGDILQIDNPRDDGEAARYEKIRKALAARGLTLTPQPVAYGEKPEAGKVRLVITRHVMTPPACPDWSQPNTQNWNNALGSNFGCSVKTNLAVQVANPRDLLDGQTHAGPEPTATTNAITTYRNRKIGVPAVSSGTSSSDSGGGSGGGGGGTSSGSN